MVGSATVTTWLSTMSMNTAVSSRASAAQRRRYGSVGGVGVISSVPQGKEGLFREIGRRWRAYEAAEFPDDMDFAEMVRAYVRASTDTRLGARLLAWEGLGDTPEDAETTRERDTRLQHELQQLRARQQAGTLDDRIDPAALLLILTSAGSALAVYPHLARTLFGTQADDPELVEHYAEQLARLVGGPPDENGRSS